MILRRQRDDVLVSAQPGGVVVQGTGSAVERFVERMRSAVETIDVPQVSSALETMSSAIEHLSRSNGTPSYFEFSPRAMELLKQHGAIPTDNGFYRSMVHDGSQIAGNLDWRAVKPGPELMQLKTMALGMALQASIDELASAVERVEDKIDHLTDRVRSVQIGEVIAHHRVIAEMVASIEDGQRISDTDWSSVDHLRTEIVRNIDAARLLLRAPVGRAEPGWSASSRASVAKRLIEDGFSDTLGILATCEHNLAGWHRVRMERVESSEPEHLDRTLAAVERDLALHRSEDQQLVDDLDDFIDLLAEPNGMEGLELWKRTQLAGNVAALRESLEVFARQRVLDLTLDDGKQLPTLRQSLIEAKDRAGGGVAWVTGKIRRRDRSADDAPPELDPSPELDGED